MISQWQHSPVLLKLFHSCHTRLSNFLMPFRHSKSPFLPLISLLQSSTLYLISLSSLASHHSYKRFLLSHSLNLVWSLQHFPCYPSSPRLPPILSSPVTRQVDQKAEDFESLQKVRLPLTLNLSQCMLELKQYQQVVELNNKLLKKHKGNTCQCEDGV